MMKCRKMLTLFLVCALLAPIFGGCEKSREALLDPNNPVPITIWHYYNGEQMNAFDALVQKFNETVGAEKGVVVDAFSQGSVMDLQTKVLDAADKKVGAGDLPDIFGAYSDVAYSMKSRDLLANIADYLSKEELEAFVPFYLEEGADGKGGYYMFPIAKSTELFMIDAISWEAMAQEMDISDELFATWEGMAEAAETYYHWTDSLTPEENDGKAFMGLDSMANYMLIGAYQMGQEMFQVKDDKVTYNVDEAAMRKLWDNYYLPYVKGYYTSEGRFRSDDMKSGALIGFVGASTGVLYFPESIELPDGSRQELAPRIYPVPVFKDYEPVAVQQGASMVIAKSTEQREYAATVFLSWFTENAQNIPFCMSSGYLPVRTDANSRAAVDKEVANAGLEVSEIIRESVYCGIDIANRYTMYTSKAFDKGTQARDIVNVSMQDKAVADAAAVRDKIAGGMAREEALAPYLAEETFQQWLAELRAALEAL